MYHNSFSCRKLFFEHHKIEQVLPNFSIYELYPLGEASVKGFIRARLQNRTQEFERLVSAGELQNFLYHAFYLTNLIDTFQTSPDNLPSSKVGVVEQFIDKAYSEESHRRISGGKVLKTDESPIAMQFKNKPLPCNWQAAMP